MSDKLDLKRLELERAVVKGLEALIELFVNKAGGSTTVTGPVFAQPPTNGSTVPKATLIGGYEVQIHIPTYIEGLYSLAVYKNGGDGNLTLVSVFTGFTLVSGDLYKITITIPQAAANDNYVFMLIVNTGVGVPVLPIQVKATN